MKRILNFIGAVALSFIVGCGTAVCLSIGCVIFILAFVKDGPYKGFWSRLGAAITGTCTCMYGVGCMQMLFDACVEEWENVFDNDEDDED